MKAASFETHRPSSKRKVTQRPRGSSEIGKSREPIRARRLSPALPCSSEPAPVDRQLPNAAAQTNGTARARVNSAFNRTDARAIYQEAELFYSKTQARHARSQMIKLLAAQLLREALAPTNQNRLSDGS